MISVPKPLIHLFDSCESAADALSSALIRDLSVTQAPLLALSGGTTPLPLLQRLQHAPLPWSQVLVTLVDERWVHQDDPDSNEGMLRRYLLNHVSAQFIPLKTNHATPEEAVPELNDQFNTLPHLTSVVVGMGTDGHFASLFPDDPSLTKGLDLNTSDTFMAAHTQNGRHPRITMTLKTILHARRRYVHITGQDKWDVLQEALNHKDPHKTPIAALLQHPCDIYYAP